jgi:hypothetical protein
MPRLPKAGISERSGVESIPSVRPELALTQHATKIVAGGAFLLTVFAGVWLVASEVPSLKMHRTRVIVVGAERAIAAFR